MGLLERIVWGWIIVLTPVSRDYKANIENDSHNASQDLGPVS